MEHNNTLPAHEKFEIEDGVTLEFAEKVRPSKKLNAAILAAYNGVELDWRDSTTVKVYFTESED